MTYPADIPSRYKTLKQLSLCACLVLWSKFGSPHLHPYFVYVNSHGSGEFRLSLSLLASAISTNFSCIDPILSKQENQLDNQLTVICTTRVECLLIDMCNQEVCHIQ